MTTNQNANVSMLDEQLDAVSGGIMPLPSPGPVEPRLGFVDVCDSGTALKRLGLVDVCDSGTALKRRGFVKNGCRGKFF